MRPSETPNLPVVAGGEPRAEVVVSPQADEQTRYAADTLVEYVARATGAVLPIVSRPEGGGTQIFVGDLPRGSDLPAGALNDLPDDGFVIHQQRATVAIVGSSSWGTRYGVHEFLERFAGVRWLMPDAWPGFPGLAGCDVPLTSRVTVDCQETIIGRPAFAERVVQPLPIPRIHAQAWDYPGEVNRTPPEPALAPMWRSWGRPNRLRHQIEFQHNLVLLVPPGMYGDATRPETYRPDFFPVINGTPYIPPATNVVNWQHRFSAPGIAEVVADGLIAQADRARVRSVSLGVNDSEDGVYGYSDDELDVDAKNHFGLPSASSAYYAFVGDVARLVAVERPDLTLGLLAYREVADPPDEPLPDNVVPFLTRDTYQWLDPVHWARDDQWLQAWRRAARRIGWWDYVEGRPYNVPRLYLRHIAKAYRYLRDNDVVGIMAESRLPLGEGPKMWVLSKLLWDPDQDVDELMAEWCRRWAGERAAPHLMSYFLHWEDFWTRRVPGTAWFDSAQRVFSAFRSAAYLDLVTADEIAQCRRWLESARSSADTADRRLRMDALIAHFDFYEASALSYPTQTASPPNATEATEVLTGAAETLDAGVHYAAARLEWADRLYDGAIARWGPRSNVPVENYSLVWSGWDTYVLWNTAHYIKDHEPTGGPVRRTVERMLKAESGTVRKYAKMVLEVADGNIATAGENMSFEAPTPAPWVVPEGSGIVTSREFAADGDQSLFVPGGNTCVISQVVDASPGFFRLSAKLLAPVDLVDDAADPAPQPPYGYYVQLSVRARAADGVVTDQFERQFPIKAAAGTWFEMIVTDVLSDEAHTAECRILVNNNPPVWIDEVSFVQLSERRSSA